MSEYNMGKKVNVSVIIPTCNSGETIGLTLKSLLSQNYKDFEVIIVDCNSKDRTLDVIRSFKREINIKIIKSRSGMLFAKIIGIKASNGKILIFLDSDHILRPGKLENIVSLIRKYYDILILEETSCSTSYSITAHLIKRYRHELHKLFSDYRIMHSIYPRVFKKSVLVNIISALSPTCTYMINMWEDKIIHNIINYIYREKIRIGLVENALYHIEPLTLITLFKKYIKYGRNAKKNIVLLSKYTECKDIHNILHDNDYAKSISYVPLQSIVKIIFNPIFLAKSIGYAIGILT